MPTTIPEFREWAVANGWMSADVNENLDHDPELPGELSAFQNYLHERGLISTEHLTPLSNSFSPSNLTILTDEPMPLISVPSGHDDHPFIPESAEFQPETLTTPTSAPSRRVVEKPMTRETMWTWIGVGGACWLLGLIILGVWIGGCFNESPKNKLKTKASQTK